jgi:hypothetical protein
MTKEKETILYEILEYLFLNEGWIFGHHMRNKGPQDYLQLISSEMFLGRINMDDLLEKILYQKDKIKSEEVKNKLFAIKFGE